MSFIKFRPQSAISRKAMQCPTAIGRLLLPGHPEERQKEKNGVGKGSSTLFKNLKSHKADPSSDHDPLGCIT